MKKANLIKLNVVYSLVFSLSLLSSYAQEKSKDYFIMCKYEASDETIVLSEIEQFQLSGKDTLRSSSAFRIIEANNNRRFLFFVGKQVLPEESIPVSSKTVVITKSEVELKNLVSELENQYPDKIIYATDFKFTIGSNVSKRTNE